MMVNSCCSLHIKASITGPARNHIQIPFHFIIKNNNSSQTHRPISPPTLVHSISSSVESTFSKLSWSFKVRRNHTHFPFSLPNCSQILRKATTFHTHTSHPQNTHTETPTKKFSPEDSELLKNENRKQRKKKNPPSIAETNPKTPNSKTTQNFRKNI